jgi:hypothetical protein
MATTITLYCLVHGDSVQQAFEIDISNDKSVSRLKKEIKKEKAPEFDDFAADKLTLWKVDIDIHDKDAIKQLVLEETDVIKNMSPASEIQEYFENAPTKKHIHVVIEYPLGKYFYPSIYELLLLPL